MGKHINITAPARSKSLFFNYKGTFSIVLLALVDAEYRFTAVQVGEFGRASDGGVYACSALGKRMAAKTLNVPEDLPTWCGGFGENAIHHDQRCRISPQAIPNATLCQKTAPNYTVVQEGCSSGR
ncbi:hypothetical protein ANANG_G00138670 [Anguilla anguilla]|uniref:DDE Tnp4 domain-containing protein n=1 Tax=Anguilla anguilla TaxID=7936 RepID=A0A9D3MAE2_ANGAN|nr:hypothetical protein ANANG_G00138670 [Anguilla anguilla]